MPTIIAYPDGSNWDFKYVDDGRPAGGAENYTFVPYDQATPEQKALLNPKLDTTNSGKFRPSPNDPGAYPGKQGSGSGNTKRSKNALEQAGDYLRSGSEPKYRWRKDTGSYTRPNEPFPQSGPPSLQGANLSRSNAPATAKLTPSSPLLSNLPTGNPANGGMFPDASAATWENTWGRQPFDITASPKYAPGAEPQRAPMQLPPQAGQNFATDLYGAGPWMKQGELLPSDALDKSPGFGLMGNGPGMADYSDFNSANSAFPPIQVGNMILVYDPALKQYMPAK